MGSGVGDSPLGETDTGLTIAPDFSLPSLDGSSFTLSDYEDGPVFLYFWASWCAPCRKEAPLIERLWPEYESQGYTFVGVNILDNEEQASAFVEEFDLTFPIALDSDGSAYLGYGVYGVPEAFFLSPGRVVEFKFLGELDEERLRGNLERIGSAS